MTGGDARNVFLGVDGGQSSTLALIGDAGGRVIGLGRGGPCNHVEASEGRGKFLTAMRGAVGEACGKAGLEFEATQFEAACLGFSGGPEDKESILRELLRTRKLGVTHDALIALSGATGGGPGVIVIAGTGSIAFGRNAEDRTARAGGWGYIYGDEGGGFDLVRQAMRAALRFEEGWGPPTLLYGKLLHASGSQTANELLHAFYSARYQRPEIASLSKVVDEAAQQGDAVASKLLNQAAQDLAILAQAVRGQLFRGTEGVRVAYTGGVFRSQTVLERFRNLMELHETVTVSAPAYGPAAGALIEAYRLAGVSCGLSGVPEFEK